MLGSFVNPRGGQGRNKPADMQQENNILVLKDVIGGLGAGKTTKAMERCSLSAPVVDTIVQHYKDLMQLHTRDGRHNKKADDDDMRHLVGVTDTIDPFRTVPGRVMPGYKGIRKSAFDKIDKLQFMNRVAVAVGRLRRGQNVDVAFYDE